MNIDGTNQAKLERSEPTKQEWMPILDRNISVLKDHNPILAHFLEARALDGFTRTNSARDDVSDAETVRNAIEQQTTLAIHGIGDGSVLNAMTNRPMGINGQRTAVYVIEPDTDRLLSMLSIFDLSEPTGLLASRDIEWFVGSKWTEQLRNRFKQELCLPIPSKIIQIGPAIEFSESTWRAVHEDRASIHKNNLRQIDDWADIRDTNESAHAMNGTGSRAARALVVSSRFTTVLRHNASEIVESLKRQGWHVELLIEQEDHHRLNEAAASHAISTIRPDVVLTLNHHRNSLPGVPQAVPFVCWIQDDLPHLISQDAARGVGPFDFYTGIWMHRYIQQWSYPKSACIPMPRLTAMVDVHGDRADFDRPVMSYVSNAGADPNLVVAGFERDIDPERPMSRVFLDVCKDLISLYERNDSVSLSSDISKMLIDQANRIGIEQVPKETLDGLTELIQLHLNNPLFRQQGLGWAEQAADELGYELAIYGAQWDSHPRFAQYAKGSISYEKELARVTRASVINLRLEHYPPTSHQRLLDAIASGGVVLSRSYGALHEPEDRFVQQFYSCGADHLQDAEEVRRKLSPESNDLLTELAKPLAEAFGLSGSDAVIDRYLYRVRENLMIDYKHAPLPPQYFETVFHDADSLRERIKCLVSDSDYHEQLRTVQGNFVRTRYSYDHNIRKLMETVAERVLSYVENTEGVIS